jgi:hypothetical protein
MCSVQLLVSNWIRMILFKSKQLLRQGYSADNPLLTFRKANCSHYVQCCVGARHEDSRLNWVSCGRLCSVMKGKLTEFEKLTERGIR